MSVSADPWPDGLLLAYYGDDFTGSTDVMDAFSAAGVPTVLFLEPPSTEDLQRFPQARCVGLAGQSRSRSPDWMLDHLPAAFKSLRQLGAPILQYKVCSTFDSSPTVGSIGQALDIGLQSSPANWSPMVVGAPRLGRFQVFGELYASMHGQVYRIDRHPTMSRHPVTPMDEADLRIHLARQTPRRIELIDFVQMTQGQGPEQLARLQGADRPVVMLDVADEASQIEAGRLIWEGRGKGLFSASSSGLQYALTAYWRSQGWLVGQAPAQAADPVENMAVISGSCSPVSAAQIAWARGNGFDAVRLSVAHCLDARQRHGEVGRVVSLARGALARGLSPIVFTAEGPDDPAVQGFAASAKVSGLDPNSAAQQLGEALAAVASQMLEHSGLKRIVVAGGDSSGAVASHLGIRALTVLSALCPGAPLCRAWSDDPRRDGLQVVLKGGQMGSVSFYGEVRAGTALRG